MRIVLIFFKYQKKKKRGETGEEDAVAGCDIF